MEKNIQEDANPNKLKELLEEFYKLERNNMPENRKRLNHYIIKIKQNIRDDQELSAFTKMLKTDDIKQQKLKIEILLQLRRNDQLLHILKETDSISTAKITTNLIFLSDMFSQMECEEFFKNIVPFIPFSATEKIINRLGKVLKDEDLAEEYFEAVRLNYGLHLARRILPRCRIDFAKSIVDGNQLRLTSRELLRFASRDRGFLKFYYDMLGKYDIGVFEVKGYENLIQYVGRTDADLFWQLNPAYKFHYNRFEKCFGKSVFNFLFLNDAAKATNRQNVVRIFKARIVYQVLKRHGKIYILLANFCEGDENEFFKIYFDNDNEEFAFIQVFLNDMPKLAYSELHRAYELKFGKNLLDNTKIFNADWLRTMSSLNRSIVLDILCEENRNLYYLYDLEKSMPLLKEKLTNDVENCEFYLKQMYKSCEFHKSVGVLENVLNYIVREHRDEPKAIDYITGKLLQRWPTVEKLPPEIWNLIDEMMSIMLYSDEITRPSYICCYISKHLLHDIREETPFNNVVLSMFDMRKHQNLDFGKTAASNRIYYEKLCDLFSYIKTDIHKTDYVNDIYSIVCEIATFNADDRTNQIPLGVYGNLLEACEITQQYWLNDVLGHFANNDPKNDYFYDLFWTRSTAAFRPKFHKFVVANPAAYLRHILLDSETMIKVLTKLRLDYVPIEIKQFLDNYCLDILQIEDYTHSRLETVFKVFLKINENTFLNIFMKMWMENRDSRPQIISLQTQLLTQLRNIHAVFPICLKLFKEEGCEKCKAAVLRCLQLMPLHQSKKTICNLSVSPQFRLRNLSVSAAGVLFANDDLTRFISEMNGRETDPVLKGNLCKRSFRLFLKNQTDLSWRLFQTNIELSGDEPGFIAKFWLHLHQIAPVYLKKFVEYTFEIVIKDGSTNKWTKTLAKRLNSKSMLENLNTTFVQTLMKSFRFDDRRTDARYKSCYSDNYHLQFIFWSSGVKQTSLLECSFEQLKQYKEEENLDDFPQKSQLAAVYDFAMTFCVFALKSKPQNGLVKKFYNQWKLIFPPDIYPEFMRLEFLDLYFDCKCDMEEFCKKSNVLMRVYVRKYGEMIMKIYSTELMGFVRVARINKMDFLTSFILSKPDRLSYCAVLKVLPGISSVKFTQEQPSLAKLMDRFRADPDPSVKLHYSYYLLYEYKD